MNKTNSETDLNRVFAFREGAPISLEPEDGPFDPNDTEAARAWLVEADVIRLGEVVRSSSLETMLVGALRTKDFKISSEGPKSSTLVALLREELADE